MRIRLQGTGARVIVLLVLFILLSASMWSVSYAQGGSATLDVFTQKEPYSGRGPNMPSDAFGPGDFMILYALLTYSESPVSNVLVAFNVKMPSNASFDLSAPTNMSGIATANFTIPTPSVNVSESEIFGTWIVTGSAQYQSEVCKDTLPFKVGWIVQLLSVQTTGENLTSQSTFGRGGDMGLVITLRSIAMTLKNATIAIVVKDQLGVAVNFSEIQGFIVPPNEEVVTVYCKAAIAATSYVGSNAAVLVSAFKTLGNGTLIPYCPPIAASFTITTQPPIEIDYPNAAVVVVLPSAKTIEVGQSLTLETIVRAEGTVAESFNVSTHCDEVLLGTSTVTNLSPYAAMIFNFSVSLSLLTVGNHTISASIPYAPPDVNQTDHYFSTWVEVTPAPPIVHDIAITNVTPSTHSVYVGGIVNIYVRVENNGTEIESNFTLSTYYNSSLIETLQVSALMPGSQENVTFSWNTSSVSASLYQISAYAALPDNETNPSGTHGRGFIDGFVQVMTPVPPVIHDIGIVSITLSTGSVYIGGIVDIYVAVRDNGTATENNCTLTAYYNSSLIETIQVTLTPGNQVSETLQWNTSTIKPGLYQISASATLPNNETDPSPGDNTLTDGFVQLMTPPPPKVIHDIGITNITLSTTSVYVGGIVNINVTVKDNGTATETFGLSAYYNSSLIKTLQVTLTAGSQVIETLAWNTSTVKPGLYQISASAPLAGDVSPGDNTFTDGSIQVMTPVAPLIVHPLYVILFIILLLFLLALLAILVLRRTKTDETEQLEQARARMGLPA